MIERTFSPTHLNHDPLLKQHPNHADTAIDLQAKEEPVRGTARIFTQVTFAMQVTSRGNFVLVFPRQTQGKNKLGSHFHRADEIPRPTKNPSGSLRERKQGPESGHAATDANAISTHTPTHDARPFISGF